MRAYAPVSPVLLLLPPVPLLLSVPLLPSVLLPLLSPSGPLPLPVESLPGLVVSVADAVGPLVSVGSGLLPVVPGPGPGPVSLDVPRAGSVSVDGTAHSPMHTSSSPHADPNERTSPMAANALRFMCTTSFERMRATFATASVPTAKTPGDYGRMISSPRPISTPNGVVVTSVPRSPT